MRTILTNQQEVKAAIRAPQSRIYCVTSDRSIHRIDQMRCRKNVTQVHPLYGGPWISDILTIYKEV